jgi:hypothetical protein
MNLDTELEVWRQDWQSESAVFTGLRQKVKRQSRWMRIVLAADILITIAIGGGVIWSAFRSPGADMFVLAGATWIFLVTAWSFAIRNNRGHWSPSASDTLSFLDISIRRCQRRLAAVPFAAALFLSEIVFCLIWSYHHSPERHSSLASWLLFGSVAFLFFGFLFWYRHKKRAELRCLLNISRDLGETTQGRNTIRVQNN